MKNNHVILPSTSLSGATVTQLTFAYVRKHTCKFISNIYVLLTVHPNIIIVPFFYQLDAQILYFNTFITFLYMFRAIMFSSSGGQLC